MKNDVIDIEVKEVQIEQFLSEKKELVLNAAQRTVEAYLEVGKHLKEVNEKLASHDPRQNRWKSWLTEVGFDKQSAHNAMSVFGRYGTGKIDFTSSTTILTELAKASNDPEKVALVEQKLAKGEKMTVAQVKEVLKKMPEAEFDAIGDAVYSIKEEKYANEIAEANIANQELKAARKELKEIQDKQSDAAPRLSASEAIANNIKIAKELSVEWKETEVKQLTMLISAYEAKMKSLGVTQSELDSIKSEVESQYIDAYNNADYSNNF